MAEVAVSTLVADLEARRSEVVRLEARLVVARAEMAELETAVKVLRRYGASPGLPEVARRTRRRRSGVLAAMQAYLQKYGPTSLNALADALRNQGVTKAARVYGDRTTVRRTAERHPDKFKLSAEGGNMIIALATPELPLELGPQGETMAS